MNSTALNKAQEVLLVLKFILVVGEETVANNTYIVESVAYNNGSSTSNCLEQ